MDTNAVEKEKLPWFYKLVLKLPFIDAETVFGDYEGVYWALILPLLLIVDFSISFFLLLGFPFPINLILTGIVPAFTFVFFIKIQLERFLNFADAIARTAKKWDVAEAMEGYLRLLEAQKTKRQKQE